MPSSKFLVFSLLVPTLISLIVWELVFHDWREHADLVIGILSARYNFVQRAAIRRTWVNESASLQEFKTKSLFVIGNEDCDIPVEDRISPFGCERLILNTSLVALPDLPLFRVTGATQSESCAPFAGISFQVSPALNSQIAFLSDGSRFVMKVMADVILTKVACVVVGGKACLEVELLDVYGRNTERNIVKHRMHGSSLGDGFLQSSELAPSVLLPKGFTGIMIARYKDRDMQCSRLCSTHLLDWDTSGLLRFLKVRAEFVFPTQNRSVFPFLFFN